VPPSLVGTAALGVYRQQPDPVGIAVLRGDRDGSTGGQAGQPDEIVYREADATVGNSQSRGPDVGT
jgi:poly(3-hydroxybutyrate) depolymerase